MTITTATIKELREATGAGPLDCRNALQAHNGNFEKAANHLREQGRSQAAKKAGRETKAGLVVVKTSGDCTCAVKVGCETDFVAFTDDLRALAHQAADLVLSNVELTDTGKLLAAHLPHGATVAALIQELIGRLGENITVRHVAHYASDDSKVIASYVHAGDIEGHYGPTEGRLGVLVELGVSGVAIADREAVKALAHDLALHIAANKPLYLSLKDIPDDRLREERELLMAQLDKENKPELIKAQIIQGRLDKLAKEICLLEQAFAQDERVSIQELLEHKSQDIGGLITINRFARFAVGN